jgi:hypothetical protein
MECQSIQRGQDSWDIAHCPRRKNGINELDDAHSGLDVWPFPSKSCCPLFPDSAADLGSGRRRIAIAVQGDASEDGVDIAKLGRREGDLGSVEIRLGSD